MTVKINKFGQHNIYLPCNQFRKEERLFSCLLFLIEIYNSWNEWKIFFECGIHLLLITFATLKTYFMLFCMGDITMLYKYIVAGWIYQPWCQNTFITTSNVKVAKPILTSLRDISKKCAPSTHKNIGRCARLKKGVDSVWKQI